MPYDVIKTPKGKFSLINTATGEVHSKGTTKKKCIAQQRLLEGIDPRLTGTGVGASPQIPTGDERTEMLEMIERNAEQLVNLYGKGVHHHHTHHMEGLGNMWYGRRRTAPDTTPNPNPNPNPNPTPPTPPTPPFNADTTETRQPSRVNEGLRNSRPNNSRVGGGQRGDPRIAPEPKLTGEQQAIINSFLGKTAPNIISNIPLLRKLLELPNTIPIPRELEQLRINVIRDIINQVEDRIVADNLADERLSELKINQLAYRYAEGHEGTTIDDLIEFINLRHRIRTVNSYVVPSELRNQFTNVVRSLSTEFNALLEELTHIIRASSLKNPPSPTP